MKQNSLTYIFGYQKISFRWINFFFNHVIAEPFLLSLLEHV